MNNQNNIKEKIQKILNEKSKIINHRENYLQKKYDKIKPYFKYLYLLFLIFIYLFYIISLFLFSEYSNYILMAVWASTIGGFGFFIIFYYNDNSEINKLNIELKNFLLSVHNKLFFKNNTYSLFYTLLENQPVLILKFEDIKKDISKLSIKSMNKIIEYITDYGFVIVPLGTNFMEKMEKELLDYIYYKSYSSFIKKVAQIFKIKYNLVDDIIISEISEGSIEITIINNKFLNNINLPDNYIGLNTIIFLPICNIIIMLLIKKIKYQLKLDSITFIDDFNTIKINLILGNKI